MLRKDYADYREAMRCLFNEVDPMGLIQAGAPADEYDPEITDLLKWRKSVTSEQVADVFERWFGAQVSEEDSARLADGIAQVRGGFGYTVE